jgi:hypothetical protein
VVSDLRTLDRFPWTGHSALLGTVPRPWQDTQTILSQFGPTPARARKTYRVFLQGGVPHGRRPELQGGGLVRSLGGWAAVTTARRTEARVEADARILGSGDFVATLLREAPVPAELPSRIPLETRGPRGRPPRGAGARSPGRYADPGGGCRATTPRVPLGRGVGPAIQRPRPRLGADPRKCHLGSPTGHHPSGPLAGRDPSVVSVRKLDRSSYVPY